MKYSTAQSNEQSREKCAGRPTIFVSAAFRELSLAQLKGAPLSVYLAYCSHANKEGIAWPSLPGLARSTGYGINAVKRAKQALIEMGVLNPIEQSREGGQFGRKKFRVNTVAPKQCHGTVAPSTVAPSTVAPKQCQEGSPSEGFPIEGNPHDAVRRPVDAERPLANPVFNGGVAPLQTAPLRAKSFSPLEKKQKLSARLDKAIRKNNSTFDCDLDDDEKAAFMFIGYSARQLTEPWVRDLPLGFVDVLREVYEEHRNDSALTPGNFCSKVIDRCMSQQRAMKTTGGDPSDYYWSPVFQEYRDELREEERQEEAASKASQAVVSQR